METRMHRNKAYRLFQGREVPSRCDYKARPLVPHLWYWDYASEPDDSVVASFPTGAIEEAAADAEAVINFEEFTGPVLWQWNA